MINVKKQSEDGRRFTVDWHSKQALADARIEGFEPSDAFMADVAALNAGEITEEEFSRRSLARARRVEEANKTSRDGESNE